MTNGCICCTLRDDLLVEVRKLAQAGRFDYLVIESTGISEPLPVATTFSFRDEGGVSLGDVARLDTMVTVVDAINLLKDYSSQDFLADRGEVQGEEDTRSLVGLLVEQIEFADVVVVNKASSVAPEQLAVVKKLVASLNADARIIAVDHGQVDLAAVLGTGLFDETKAVQHPLWAKELYGYASHQPETEEYGIESFVYRARAPFDPARLYALLTGEGLDAVVRAKGHFWLATRPIWWVNWPSRAARPRPPAWVDGGAASRRTSGPRMGVSNALSPGIGTKSGATGARNWSLSASAWMKP
jgi:G3E family GTPase